MGSGVRWAARSGAAVEWQKRSGSGLRRWSVGSVGFGVGFSILAWVPAWAPACVREVLTKLMSVRSGVGSFGALALLWCFDGPRAKVTESPVAGRER